MTDEERNAIIQDALEAETTTTRKLSREHPHGSVYRVSDALEMTAFAISKGDRENALRYIGRAAQDLEDYANAEADEHAAAARREKELYWRLDSISETIRRYDRLRDIMSEEELQRRRESISDN